MQMLYDSDTFVVVHMQANEPVECGEYIYNKDVPDTFRVAVNNALPAGYVWLEWIMWIPQSAIK